jgi:hypothetical protein
MYGGEKTAMLNGLLTVIAFSIVEDRRWLPLAFA